MMAVSLVFCSVENARSDMCVTPSVKYNYTLVIAERKPQTNN
jgi:hypothetical protein